MTLMRPVWLARQKRLAWRRYWKASPMHKKALEYAVTAVSETR